MRVRLYGQIVPLPALIGLVIIAMNLFAALFAPIIAPFPEAEVVGDAWAEADWHYLLGLDNLGRDIFSRLLYGARLSIGLSLLITILSFIIGVIGGFTAAIGKGDADLDFRLRGAVGDGHRSRRAGGDLGLPRQRQGIPARQGTRGQCLGAGIC